jgi:extradiol dioxygenase family protein
VPKGTSQLLALEGFQILAHQTEKNQFLEGKKIKNKIKSMIQVPKLEFVMISEAYMCLGSQLSHTDGPFKLYENGLGAST